jgi:tetratricopeptide (TPR) repeat protein
MGQTLSREPPASALPAPAGGSRLNEAVPKITDFGLAKLLDNPAGQTQTGAILGTPSYMAPEQAAGKVREVGPAADVYALGAILYEALTGRPPFKAASTLETLEQVRSQEPVAPSRLQPSIPADLQTVCLKCMAKEPGRRYASALELADDLRRFGQGEPIRARPVGRRERLAKWVRRRPATAALVAVSALALVALVLGLWRHNASLRAERERADASYQQARNTINQILARLKDKPLTDVPKAAELRHDLQEIALAFFQGIPKEEDNPDPAVRLDVALAYRQIGAIQVELGRFDAAEENTAHAQQLLEGLAASHPGDLDYRVQLAGTYHERAVLWSYRGRQDDALALLRKALNLRRELTRERPENPDWQNDLAKTYLGLGFSYISRAIATRAESVRLENAAEAESNWLQAQAIWERLAHDHPQVAAYQSGLATCCDNLGLIYTDRRRSVDAEACFGKAERILKALVRDHPEELQHREVLGDTYESWAILMKQTDRPSAAVDRYTQAIDTVEAALKQEPRLRRARATLANVLGGRALAYLGLKRHADAERDWQRACQVVMASTDLGSSYYSQLCGTAAGPARAGAHAWTAALAGALRQRKGLPEDDVYRIAVAYAVCIPAARQDAKLTSARRQELAETYATEAVALLARLQQAGYFRDAARVANLKAEADFMPLRDRPKYQKLLRAVEGKGPGRER